jgi:hypothetical protein
LASQTQPTRRRQKAPTRPALTMNLRWRASVLECGSPLPLLEASEARKRQVPAVASRTVQGFTVASPLPRRYRRSHTVDNIVIYGVVTAR